jgi:hypothetical protein
MSSKTRPRKTRTTASTTGTAPTLQSVPAQTVATKIRTDTEDKLWEALHANPNSTAADLSTGAKIGKSTAQKILVKWAADGSVTRTAGIAEGGRRAADLWAITDVDTTQVDPNSVHTAATKDTDTTDTTTDTTHTEPAAPVVVPVVPDTPAIDDATNDATDVEGDLFEPTDTTPTDTATDDAQDRVETEAADLVEAEPVVAEVSDPAADGAGAKKTRLAPGELRGMVEDYLRDHPGEQFGPTTIANALGGKSSGAVSNALDKLVEDGVAVKTQDEPRRFALTPSEQ